MLVAYSQKVTDTYRVAAMHRLSADQGLVGLLERQWALLKALDLVKDEAGSRSTDAAEERLAARSIAPFASR